MSITVSGRNVAGGGGNENDKGGMGSEYGESFDEGGSALTHHDSDSFDSIIDQSLGGSEHHVVEHSPQGRYVRFNVRTDSNAYKEIWKAYDTSEGVEVAWNTLCIEDIPRADKKRILNEINILEKLDHPNIITFYTSWYNRETKQIVFITELINTGSLIDFVQPIPVLRWKIVKKWAKQILEGLAFLHGQDPPIIHRNLNCDNIFIIANTGELKIGDLGLSTVCNHSESCIGTAPFMAPELFEEDYDEKVDIYAFGMSIIQMITKKAPYTECEAVGEVYRRVTALIPPNSLGTVRNENARAFIQLCLSPDPTERPSARDLLNHPFLKEDKQEDAMEVVLGHPSTTMDGGAGSTGYSSVFSSVASAGSLSRNSSTASLQRLAIEPGKMTPRTGTPNLPGEGCGGEKSLYRRNSSTLTTEGGGGGSLLHSTTTSKRGGGAAGGPSTTTTGGQQHALVATGGAGGSTSNDEVDLSRSGLVAPVAQKPAAGAPVVVVSNGSKLHLRFFSEPHGSFSEISDDESDLDSIYGPDAGSITSTGEDGGGVDGSRSIKGEGDEREDELTFSRSRTRGRTSSSIIAREASKSPRSVLKEEERNEDDDLLIDMPTGESSCKKVKVMGGRNAELVEEVEYSSSSLNRPDALSLSNSNGQPAVLVASTTTPGGGAVPPITSLSRSSSWPTNQLADRPPVTPKLGTVRPTTPKAPQEKLALEPGAVVIGGGGGGGSITRAESPSGAGHGLDTSRSASPSPLKLVGPPIPPGSTTIGGGVKRSTSGSSSEDEGPDLGTLGRVASYDISVRSATSSSSSASSLDGSVPPSPTKSGSPSGSPSSVDSLRRLPATPGHTTALSTSGNTTEAEGGGKGGGAVPAVEKVLGALKEIVATRRMDSGGEEGQPAQEEETEGEGGAAEEEEEEMTPKTGGLNLSNENNFSRSSSGIRSSGSARVPIMTLLIRTPVKGKMKEVEFEFNLATDQPAAVAKEMVMELDIPEAEEEGLAQQIAKLREQQVAKRAAKKEAKEAAKMAAAAAKQGGGGGGLSSSSLVSTALVPTTTTAITPTTTSSMPATTTTGPIIIPSSPQQQQQPSIPTLIRSMSGQHLLSQQQLLQQQQNHQRTISQQRLPSEKQLLLAAAAQQQHSLSSSAPKAPLPNRLPSAPMLPTAASSSALSSLPHQPNLSTSTARTLTRSATMGVGGSSTYHLNQQQQQQQQQQRGGHMASSLPSSLLPKSPLLEVDEDLEHLSLCDVEKDDSLDEEDVKDMELQRLRQEYIKSVHRAQKAFKARMESMLKCKEDKEEWHRKLLEKHEKLMADFDRRLHAATDDQSKRLHEMKEQWHTVKVHHREVVKARMAAKTQPQLPPLSTPGSASPAQPGMIQQQHYHPHQHQQQQA